MSESEQLAALGRIHELLEEQGIDYYLFGGWAVDVHAGSVTRVHDDLDIAVWLKDHNRIAALLAGRRVGSLTMRRGGTTSLSTNGGSGRSLRPITFPRP